MLDLVLNLSFSFFLALPFRDLPVLLLVQASTSLDTCFDWTSNSPRRAQYKLWIRTIGSTFRHLSIVLEVQAQCSARGTSQPVGSG